MELLFLFLQTYTKEAVDSVKEALTLAQRSKALSPNIFEVSCNETFYEVFSSE